MAAIDGITTVFIDDGGVLNDNRLRAPQWAKLVGEYFAPRLGGAPEAWAEVNSLVFRRLWEEHFGPRNSRRFSSHREWNSAYYRRWMREMCEGVGVPGPATDDEAERLARDADDYITRHIHAAIPGAADAVRVLAAHGLTLHTGSGGESRQLANYLDSLGVREHFGTLYGADLVDVPKDRPEYHRRVLEHSGTAPVQALFIDSDPEPLEWAAALGAKTALVDQRGDGRFDWSVPSLAALVGELLGPD